ncbi:RDD family protein [Lignipirellula cremea]|uniref:RDD family protein n=1 Tax=Lignipirellula cremea TaxID=2528010 RepID=A0A518DX67_9BACT|nr:RDD family protein [Lignipirellula cremea]QDU96451.1 RDD family protein [Lignipirellula cremea]
MSTANAQLDNTIGIVTPENITFQYRVAGPFRRGPAFLVDIMLRVLAIIAVYIGVGLLTAGLSMVMPFLASVFSWLAGVAWIGLGVLVFAVDQLYGGLFETYMNGQTPGKRMLGLRVVTTSGQPINGMQAVMRNVLRYADMMPMLPLASLLFVLDRLMGERTTPEAFVLIFVVPTFLLGLGAMALTPRRQRLGDLVCDTMVISENQKWSIGLARLEDARAPELAAFIPARFEFSRPLAKALAMYVERRQGLSELRRREIAQSLAQPLLVKFGLPPDTSYDLMLCAMYYRAFIADRGEETRSPFGLPGAQNWASSLAKGPPAQMFDSAPGKQGDARPAVPLAAEAATDDLIRYDLPGSTPSSGR